MPTINIVLLILLAVTTISIALSVAAWFFLSSIGSKLSILERETDKRSVEFDTLRKEHASNGHTSTAATVIEDSEPNMNLTPESEMPSMKDTIQIFRNVRGNFEDTDTAAAKAFNYIDPSQPLPEMSEENQYQNGSTPLPQSAMAQSAMPPPPPTTFNEISLQSSNFETELNTPPVPEMVLYLYSDTTKDADFQTLWLNISQILQQHHTPKISIDFSNINFLYEKEMDYLEKINYLIAKQGGSLALVNCDKDLYALINRKQQLGSIVSL